MQTIYAKPALWPDALPAGCEASHSNFLRLVHIGESWWLLHAGTGERIAVNHMGSPTLVFQGGLGVLIDSDSDISQPVSTVLAKSLHCHVDESGAVDKVWIQSSAGSAWLDS
eukprot:6490609-Amphidinium_carterae.1